MRLDGTLTHWNDERGFGFITPDHGGGAVFVHARDFAPGSPRPCIGLRLSFTSQTGPKGPRAQAVRLLQASASPIAPAGRPGTARTTTRPRPRVEAPAPWTATRRLALPLLVVVYTATAWAWPVSPWWMAIYAGLSVLTLFTYAFDKTAAVRKTWRTAESRLHLLALLGGWPGALLAQQWLRHKSSKSSFQAVFWLTVAANLAGFVWLHSPWGRTWLPAALA